MEAAGQQGDDSKKSSWSLRILEEHGQILTARVCRKALPVQSLILFPELHLK